jgi:hypothetical protein
VASDQASRADAHPELSTRLITNASIVRIGNVPDRTSIDVLIESYL